MAPFHAALADENGQAITEVDGTIESPKKRPDHAPADSELQDTPSFMQGGYGRKDLPPPGGCGRRIHDQGRLGLHQFPVGIPRRASFSTL